MEGKTKQKDPAFLFYSSDFIVGTMFMNHEQVGKYIRILCALHQNGRLMRSQIDSICGGITDACILAKLSQDEKGLYYNQRLDNEVEKRKLHSEKQKQNALMRWHKSGNAVAMPLGNENEIENDNTKKAARKKFVLPTLEQVIAYFDENGYTAEHATRAFNYYNSAEWTDSKGNAVKNWKQKMQANWFKEDGKKGQGTGKKKKFRIDSPAGSVVKEFTFEELKAFQHSIRNSNGAVTIREEL